jgi:hypothetical protein
VTTASSIHTHCVLSSFSVAANVPKVTLYSATSAGRHGAETLPVMARNFNEYQAAATFGDAQAAVKSLHAKRI